MIGFLAAQGSMSSAIFCQLRLTREVIKEATRRLQGQRKTQVVLASILSATRFKYFDKRGVLVPVSCVKKCGQIETFEHLLQCNNLIIPDEKDGAEVRIQFLCRMAIKATHGARPIPTPIDPGISLEGGEISLADETDSDGCSAATVDTALSFDGVD